MKVDGSLGSLVQGVSQQAPTQRRKGQHGAQVNMVADPVRGLSRRHGSIWQAEKLLGSDATEPQRAANLVDAAGFRSFDYMHGGRELVILYRAAARITNSTLPAVIVYDKTNKQFLTVVRNVTDTVLDTLEAGGASAITAIGKYVFIAGNTITATGLSVPKVDTPANQGVTVAWVRGGAYKRTYSITVIKTDDTPVSFSHTTPTASYPGVLDTSGVSAWIPDTAGSSAGTTTALATANEVLGPKANGSTYTPVHYTGAPLPNLTLTVHIPTDAGETVRTLSRNADYTFASGVITFRRSFTNPVKLTYQYPTGGSTATTVYATETTNESALIEQVNDAGVADLAYKDWNPTSLSARHGDVALTNSAPALPASATEYCWNAGDKQVVFHQSMVGRLNVTITYTHTKVLSNPNYTKQVASVTNAYNTAVTKWIGDAVAAIQPEAIAQALVDAAIAAGMSGVYRVGSTIAFDGVKEIAANDGGDGSLLKGLANTAQSVADLTDLHFIGKHVRVSPTGGESFYMRATSKNPLVVSGVGEVLWVEGVGIEHVITSALCLGVASGSNFYMASSATLLNAILPGDHPTYAISTVGDNDSSPMPYFVGRKISYLGVFQDRLLIGSDAVIRCSKVGDYLNFFRSSVLTVPADDPLEMLSQGSEDDLIRYSALYDRDLVLFGKRQYLISGRAPLTPTSGNMPVMSSHEGANDARPVAAGSVIFYAKQGHDRTSVHQIEPGRNSEAPESFPVSSQLDDFMPGYPSELTWAPKPTTLLVRVRDEQHKLFVFSYLDSSDRRLQDCWHEWRYDEALGPIIGASVVREGVVLFTLRQVLDAGATQRTYAVADLQSLDGQLSPRPYLDSSRVWEDVVATPGSLHDEAPGWAVAYGDGSDSRLLGVADVSDTDAVALLVEDLGDEEHLIIGRPFESYWVPTNPLMRDGDGGAMSTGRLVVTSLLVGFTNSSGFRSTVTAYGQDAVYTFNGRLLGDVGNLVGRVPVTTGRQSVIVGREAQEYTHTIAALTWLPLSIAAVDWTGQAFHRPRRVG